MTATTEPDLALLWECTAWLSHEAELLDDNRQRDWLALLDPEIDYRVPVRVTRERTRGAGFSEQGFHMLEDHASLEVRVDRLDSEYAWAEDPPSRMRRLVTNVRLGEIAGDTVAVRSNFLYFRGARYDAPGHDLLVGERQDVLRRTPDGLKLLRRMVLLDHTTLGTPNLAFFF
jgi:3-phenylpropionate/cinnamic acid dioxygenase small subunit